MDSSYCDVKNLTDRNICVIAYNYVTPFGLAEFTLKNGHAKPKCVKPFVRTREAVRVKSSGYNWYMWIAVIKDQQEDHFPYYYWVLPTISNITIRSRGDGSLEGQTSESGCSSGHDKRLLKANLSNSLNEKINECINDPINNPPPDANLNPMHLQPAIQAHQIAIGVPQAVTIPNYHVFLSYAHGNGNHDRVREIYQHLHFNGINTFIDIHGNFGNMLVNLPRFIERSGCFIAFVTANYITQVNRVGDLPELADWCRYEFDHAIYFLGTVKIIPVVMERDLRNSRAWAGVFGRFLRNHVYVDFTDNVPIEIKIHRLMTRIRQVVHLNYVN